jgi:glycosyltransferase involved in cell wall biosynthesis
VKVSFHSPLPPAKTGVADYSAVLLRHLRRLGTVEISSERADIDLYHLGNNQLHQAIYRRALERPGVVVIHDAVLQHFFLGSLTEREYIAEFEYNYGSWSGELARGLWRERARSATDPRYFRYPMVRRVCEASKAVIVHNPAAAQMVREHAPAARIYEIPHLWEQPEMPPLYEVERLRKHLGVPANVLLCGVLGHLRESKRVAAVIRAVRRVRTKYPVALLLAGEFASTDLERGIQPLLASDGIIRAGYLSESDWWLHAAAVDLGVNLKYPAAGETSGIAIRLMGLGKPVILTSGLETSDLPEFARLTVDPGVAEEEMLAVYLAWAIENRPALIEIGRRAASHVRSQHAVERIAGIYWQCVSDCYHGT